uniref:Mur ligase family protein n=1 Tax=Microlunatus elymi TaxID=2596828 RepID=UPI00143D0574|nr:UDP-N-acetylmuramoyl-L-alanyl-D-glutamate--2,6-diaminopimelate ligase [Microlunatus elymi]
MSAASVVPGQDPPGLRPASTTPYPVRRLAETLGADVVSGELDGVSVTGVAFDSRTVRRGDLYVGLPGANTHGARYAADVLKAGAVAVLSDRAGADLLQGSDSREITGAAPVLVVDDPRQAMAAAAAEVYGRPATRLTMFGVTGTNGKTTTNYLLAAGLRAVGRRCGVIGTLGYFLDGEEIVADRTTVTTPESADLQALLAILVERGADCVVMEVSSHALALGRADEIVFDVAGFTNFGRDHLDFHGSLEAYFEAKASLFTAERARAAVINTDDARGPELVARADRAGLRVLTTSLAGADGDGEHDHFRCLGVDRTVDPTAVRIATPQAELVFRLGLPGGYNVANAITALGMLQLAGLDLPTAAAGLATATVPGRLQRVDLGPDAPRAFVDFAHTPQAISSVLTELRATVNQAPAPGISHSRTTSVQPHQLQRVRLTRSGAADEQSPRLICVVGCGGDRDPAKRGPMGAVAAELADMVIITDDNPRTEDPASIRAAALDGARQQAAHQSRPVVVLDGGDRAAAIRTALRQAGPHDVIALLGKGHERGQEITGRVLPFDDVEQLLTGWQDVRDAGEQA